MIGMPRITLIRPALSSDNARTPETRSSAQTRPRMVDSSSDPKVTRIVSPTPCSRIGRNSAASCKNFSIDSNHALPPDRASGALRLEPPFVENLVDFAIRPELGERGVDLAEQLRIALADADGDGADDGRLVGIDQPSLGKAALLEVIGEDRIVGETGLETAGIDVAQDVRNG